MSNPVRSSESSNLLMVIGLIVPSGVDLGGMASASELGRLSSAAGGLGGRPCREIGVLRASSAAGISPSAIATSLSDSGG